MKRPGHLLLTLRSGEAPGHVPAHIDYLSGAARPAGRIDGGALDRILSRHGGGARVLGVFHARESLGRTGEHHTRFDDVEEALGLSRTYRVEIGNPEASDNVVAALRDLSQVEAAGVQTLALTEDQVEDAATVDAARARAPHEQINAPAALVAEPGDERVTTALVDTGIVIGHPEFQRRCLAGYDTVDLGLGRINEHMRLVGDSRGHDYNPHDDVGHGCHVAGIVGAHGWRLPPGVAGRALLLAVRVLAGAFDERSGKRVGIGCLPDIDCGLKVAVDLGARVINMSFGTPESSVDAGAPTPHRAAVLYAAHHGCTLVAAAGNSGIAERIFPAALPEVIAVAAVDAANRRARFSTMGDHVALAAPGVNVISCGRRGYQANSGTSFAAPFVTGVASLMLARADRRGRALGGAEVKRLLIAAARPLGGGFSPETGHGLLDAAAALRQVDRYLEATP